MINYIVWIGCLGDLLSICGLNDFVFGIGVMSCYDGYGCVKVGFMILNLYYVCVFSYGVFN